MNNNLLTDNQYSTVNNQYTSDMQNRNTNIGIGLVNTFPSSSQQSVGQFGNRGDSYVNMQSITANQKDASDIGYVIGIGLGLLFARNKNHKVEEKSQESTKITETDKTNTETTTKTEATQPAEEVTVETTETETNNEDSKFSEEIQLLKEQLAEANERLDKAIKDKTTSDIEDEDVDSQDDITTIEQKYQAKIKDLEEQLATALANQGTDTSAADQEKIKDLEAQLATALANTSNDTKDTEDIIKVQQEAEIQQLKEQLAQLNRTIADNLETSEKQIQSAKNEEELLKIQSQKLEQKNIILDVKLQQDQLQDNIDYIDAGILVDPECKEEAENKIKSLQAIIDEAQKKYDALDAEEKALQE